MKTLLHIQVGDDGNQCRIAVEKHIDTPEDFFNLTMTIARIYDKFDLRMALIHVLSDPDLAKYLEEGEFYSGEEAKIKTEEFEKSVKHSKTNNPNVN